MEIIYYIIEVRSNRVSKLNKTIALSSVHCFPFVSFPLFFSFLHVTSAIVEIIFIARRKWHAHLFAFWTFYSAPFIIIFWRVCARERERERKSEWRIGSQIWLYSVKNMQTNVWKFSWTPFFITKLEKHWILKEKRILHPSCWIYRWI